MTRRFQTAVLSIALGAAIVTPLVFAAEEKQKELPVALEGKCAVCLYKGGAIVDGTEEYTVEFDGMQYLFPDESTQKKFAENPAKYAPVLNGDCTVCYQHGGNRPAGKVEHHLVHNERLYLFPSEGVMEEFQKDPEKYESVDLAYDGNCAVCLKDGGAENPGKAEFTARYKGMRYQFPNEALLEKFENSPAQYAVSDKTAAKADTPEKSSKVVSIEGRSACAGCEFKVRPTLNPEQLGLAVVVSETEIYIIEKAHDDYEKIYDDRFDSLQLAVKGKVLKKDGRYTWIEPEKIDIVQ